MIRLSGRHIRAARALLGWTQEDLAKKARVALGTVKRMERFDGPMRVQYDTAQRVASCLERAYIEFLEDDGPGVRLIKRSK